MKVIEEKVKRAGEDIEANNNKKMKRAEIQGLKRSKGDEDPKQYRHADPENLEAEMLAQVSDPL